MRITPLDIRQKTFEKNFRGYEKDEVNAFLLTLSQEWERVLDENKEARQNANIQCEMQKVVGKPRRPENFSRTLRQQIAARVWPRIVERDQYAFSVFRSAKGVIATM